MALAVQGYPVDGLGQLGTNVLGIGALQSGAGNSGVAGASYAPADTSGGYYSSSAGGSSPSYTVGYNDPGTLASYDESIGNTQAAINRTAGQLASGNSQIDASYQDALNQLLLGKNQANATYTTNKQQTAQDYVGAKNTIGANAGSSLNGLERLLGSRGAGGSSAALYGAPQAVAGDATIQRTGAGTTFGQNNQSLDTNWNNYLTGYNNQVSSAGNQRQQQEQSLQQQINNNKASLLQTLASLSSEKAAAAGGNPQGAAAPFLAQANQLLDSTANYTVNPVTYQTQAYTAPSLAAYTVNPAAAPTFNGQPQTTDYTTPYLASLLGDKKQTTNTAAAPVGA